MRFDDAGDAAAERYRSIHENMVEANVSSIRPAELPGIASAASTRRQPLEVSAHGGRMRGCLGFRCHYLGYLPCLDGRL